MVKNIMLLTFLFFACLMVSNTVPASEEHPHSSDRKALSINLSPKLHQALSEEMRAIEQAMMTLVKAMAAGDWSIIAKTGEQIRDSYIMKQKLSKEDFEELHRTLPDEFREMDERFHQRAGQLSRAALEKDKELVAFYSYKLMEGCMSCHVSYAAGRFPGFSKPVRHEHHH
jgi:hypothetical protein